MIRLRAWWRRTRKYPTHLVAAEGARRVVRKVRLRMREWVARISGLRYPTVPVTGPYLSRASDADADRLAARLGVVSLRPGHGVPLVAPFAAEDEGEILDQAEQVRNHVFEFLGSGPVELGPEIDWSIDFKSGYRWPSAHIAKLSVSPDAGCDVKIPWELGRFHHLGPLVKAYAITGDPRWALEVQDQVDSFLRQNPPEHGVQWLSSMDVAIRATNWLYALLFLTSGTDLSPEFQARWVTSLWHHAHFVRRNLSANLHSRGNHYLSEIVGLLHLGLAFGESREGRSLALYAARRLRREMRHQVYEDGTSWEASTNYHRLVTELFAQAATVLEQTTVHLNLPTDAEFDSRLRKMFAFVYAYTRPDGSAPLIGDVDDGRLLPFAGYRTDPGRHCASLTPYERWVPKKAQSCEFRKEGGFFVLRAPEAVVVVRCGRVGLNGRGAHDHADQLSIDVTMGGVSIVVDPGCYVYAADPEMRSYFRSTSAHNTIAVDGTDQLVFSELTPFEVDKGATGTLERAEVLRSGAVFRGRHDGYLRLKPKVLHRRQVELAGSGRRLQIKDWLEGPRGWHSVTVAFQLVPDCQALLTAAEGLSDVRIIKAGRNFLWKALETGGLGFELGSGWVSPRYGVRLRAPRIVLTGCICVPAHFSYEIEIEA